MIALETTVFIDYTIEHPEENANNFLFKLIDIRVMTHALVKNEVIHI